MNNGSSAHENLQQRNTCRNLLATDKGHTRAPVGVPSTEFWHSTATCLSGIGREWATLVGNFQKENHISVPTLKHMTYWVQSIYSLYQIYFQNSKEKIAQSQKSESDYIKLHTSLRNSFFPCLLFIYTWLHSEKEFIAEWEKWHRTNQSRVTWYYPPASGSLGWP